MRRGWDVDATTNDVVAPWWNMPYEEQLKAKEKEMRQVLKRCNRRIMRKDREKEKKTKENGRAGSVKKPCNEYLHNGGCKFGDRCKFLHISLDEYEKMMKESAAAEAAGSSSAVDQTTNQTTDQTTDQTTTTQTTTQTTTTASSDSDSDNANPEEPYSKLDEEDGQLCRMLPILTAEPHEGYRNKCSFTIGGVAPLPSLLGKDKNDQPCVGFRMGSFINGNVVIGDVQ